MASSNRIVAAAGAYPFGTQTGMRDDGRLLVHGGTAGFALFGGFFTLRPGEYTAVVWLEPGPVPLAGSGTIEICTDLAHTMIAKQSFEAPMISEVAPFLSISFVLGRTMQDVELRVFGEAGFSATIASVELMRNEAVAPRDRSLHILYVSQHVTLEFDEMRMLTGLGHRVFSMEGGAYHVPARPNRFRPMLDQLYRRDDFLRYMRMGLNAAFLAAFDVIVMVGQPRKVPAFCDLAGRIPIVYRGIGQVETGCEDPLLTYAERLHVVRYSERELGIAGIARPDDVIYFGKYASDYEADWIGGGPIVSVMNGFVPRSAACAPTAEQYGDIAGSFACALYGSENEGFAHAHGLLPWSEMPAMLARASLYLHLGLAGPSYNLPLVEAMAAGIPVVAPTAAFVAATVSEHRRAYARVDPARYEVPALLHHDERVLFSSIAEAKAKIAWLLKHKDYCRMLSRRQRDTFAAVFAAERIQTQWESVLRRVTAASS